MKKVILSMCLIGLMLFTLTGCSEANRVSHNLSKEADNFNVVRELTVINGISDDVVFQMTGKMAIEVDETENQLEVTVENEDGTYAKHFVGLSDNTLYVVQDKENIGVDKYKYTINYNPKMWVPVTAENID